jgi:hypothetical protein
MQVEQTTTTTTQQMQYGGQPGYPMQQQPMYGQPGMQPQYG